MAASLGLDLALAPSRRETVFEEGTARLYRVVGAQPDPEEGRRAVLLVPSLINEWFVLDLRPGASLVEALDRAGLSVYVLDWGQPEDEDRYLDWDDLVRRVGRMARRARKDAGGAPIGLFGYCIGATLSCIALALDPSLAGAFVNLAGPIDFTHAGAFRHMVDPRWFDVGAITSAGNMPSHLMRAGFFALRPIAESQKGLGVLGMLDRRDELIHHLALLAWAERHVDFPAAAYARYIRELYQENQLMRGAHVVGGQRVDLGRIDCPLLTVTTTEDVICPAAATRALAGLVASRSIEDLSVRGGHVGGVVGEQGPTRLYPEVARFFERHLSPAH